MTQDKKVAPQGQVAGPKTGEPCESITSVPQTAPGNKPPSVLDALSIMATLQEWGLVDAHKRLTLPYHDAQAALKLFKPDIAAQGFIYSDFQSALGVAHRQKAPMPKAEPGLPMLKVLSALPEETTGLRQAGDAYYALRDGQEAAWLGTGRDLHSFVAVSSNILQNLEHMMPVSLKQRWDERVWPHFAQGITEIKPVPTRLEQTWEFLDLYEAHRNLRNIKLADPDALTTWHPGSANSIPIGIENNIWYFSSPDFSEWCRTFWKGADNIQARLLEAGGSRIERSYQVEGQRHHVTLWCVPSKHAESVNATE